MTTIIIGQLELVPLLAEKLCNLILISSEDSSTLHCNEPFQAHFRVINHKINAKKLTELNRKSDFLKEKSAQ